MKQTRVRFLSFWIGMLFLSCFFLVSCQKQDAPSRPTAGPGWEEEQEGVAEMNGGYQRREILISVFWPPMTGFTTAEQYDYLVEGGIDLLEWGTDPIFTKKNTIQEMLRLCGERGLKVTIADNGFNDLIGKTDEEIRRLVEKYRDVDCVAGYYLRDEPSNANPYGRVGRIMAQADPDCIAQLNMLPAWALADAEGHAVDWINAIGPENLRYLSYDQYPFPWTPGSAPAGMYVNMNLVREIGLKYGVDTALYIQSVGVTNNFRHPTVAETRYHTSAALAYGYKNLKYFTWMTPVNRGEDFTDAIIRPDGSKSDTFDGIAENNRNIKKVGGVLGNLDAVEIYHNGTADTGITMLENNWYLQATDESDFLVSLMVDRFDGRNYLMIVNKNFQDDVSLTFRLNGIEEMLDITNGPDDGTSVSIKNNRFTANFLAGGFRLYRLADGVNLELPYQDASDTNLALEKPVYSSFSVGEGGLYTCKVNDGVRFSTDASLGWQVTVPDGGEGWLIVDLLRPVSLNRIDLYAMGKGAEYGFLFPTDFQIWYSRDNKDYTLLLEKDRYVLSEKEPPSFRFDTVKARFIKITITGGLRLGDVSGAAFSEVELYYDDGSLPAMASPDRTGSVFPAGDNVARGRMVLVSSTSEYPQWGWLKRHLNDGITAKTDTHSGWTSQTGKNREKNAQEWVLFYLAEKELIDRVVVYPVEGGAAYFPSRFVVEVSEDGLNWIEAGVHEESGAPSQTPQTVSFEAIPARYVKVTATELRGSSSGDGYLFQAAEIEIYRAGAFS